MNSGNQAPMDTNIIDRLFLELSQVTKATTGKELRLEQGILSARQAALELCWQIEKCAASEEQTKCSDMAAQLHTQLNMLCPDTFRFYESHEPKP